MVSHTGQVECGRRDGPERGILPFLGRRIPPRQEVLDLAEAVEASRLPVWIGSGITVDNLVHYKRARGLIVGSSLKREGVWRHEVDDERCKRLVEAFRET